MKDIFKAIVISILRNEARLVLFRHKPKIVAVTGTVGKTSTKDVIFECLKPHFYTRKSEKSFNSEIGLPLTILGLSNAWNNPIKWLLNILLGLKAFFSSKYPEWLVLEVGIDRRGDMARVSKWLKSDVVVFTKFSDVPVHVEYFNSPEEVMAEKSLLVNTLKMGGTLILNRDDENVFALKEKAKRKSLSFGFNDSSDIRASNQEFLYDSAGKLLGVIFRADYEGNSVPVRIIDSLGQGQVYSALAGLAVGTAVGLNAVSLSDSISDYRPTSGRMRILSGIKGTQILDDTYNASPVALMSALNTLEMVKSGRKIVVLGDMMELGKYSKDEHRRAGVELSKFADLFIAVGSRMKFAVDGALENGMKESNVLHFDTSREAGLYLQNLLTEGDLVLVKGSQSMRMERAVEEIMAEPEKKKDLLVRQDTQWLDR